MIGAFDIERVDRDAPLRADAGKGDVEAVVGNGLREAIEQTDLIAGLDFHDGAFHRQLVVDVHGGRKRAVQGFAVGSGLVTGGSDLFSLGDDLRIKVLV